MKKLLNYSLIPAIALLVMVSVIAIRCKKPTEGIRINVNTSSLFHYTALVQVNDPSGGGKVPEGLSVEVTGDDASAIYGLDGKKALVVSGGIIVAAVHPKMEPTAGHDLHFNLKISGPGYLTLIVPMTITSLEKSQTLQVNILNLTTGTEGVTSASKTFTAVNGVVNTTSVLATSSHAEDKTTITIPAGTQLQDANGNAISASSVTVSANNFDASNQTAINLFPGSSLSAPSVTNAQGVQVPAFFLPAGFVNIDMSAGGVAVKKFSSPITIQMVLDPTFKDPTTGLVVAAGGTIGIYSYSTDTGAWKFEQNAPVTSVGGQLVATFTTTHLTIYFGGVTLPPLDLLTINIDAPWFNAALARAQALAVNIKVIAKINNGPSYDIYTQTFQLDSLLTFFVNGSLPIPPSSTSSVELSFYSVDNVLLGTATIIPGTTSITVTLAAPAANPPVTLSLKLDCADVGKGILTPPDFYLLYKKSGTRAPAYQVLGQVQNGQLTTTELDASQMYDFKAIFNDKSKEVKNHTVAENIPGNQTIGSGSFNGTKTPDANRISIANLCDTLP